MRWIHGIAVQGIDVDGQTRCRHWRGVSDVVALKMKCCGIWTPCHACHAAVADHPAAVWPLAERHATAVLCGACGARLSIAEYLVARSRCPRCGVAFNPGCANHHHLYFALTPEERHRARHPSATLHPSPPLGEGDG